MKSAVPVHKVLRLPRALQPKVLKVLRLPRNLAPLLPRNLLLKALKVLRLPRNLHIQIHIAQRCRGGSQWQVQLFVKGHFVFDINNFLFDRI